MNSKPFYKTIWTNMLFGLIIIAIIFITISSNNLDPIGTIKNLAIEDLIAVLVISAFVMGTSFILGVNLKQAQDYHFKSFEFSTKYQILTIGGMYVLYIIYTISATFYDIKAKLLLFIPLLFIIHGYYSTEKFELVTLKMITFNEQGSKKIKTINELELYDTTDKDYRFKDSDGNEFIVPNNQVLEIIYSNKLNEIEESQQLKA